tara:strand:- start:1644 stop:1748 length:105 start_codon:yes stop_codon:yes gene_type:complete
MPNKRITVAAAKAAEAANNEMNELKLLLGTIEIF